MTHFQMKQKIRNLFIRLLPKLGFTHARIGALVGLTQPRVSQILRNGKR